MSDYDIAISPDGRLVTVQMWGFWTDLTLQRFVGHLAQVVRDEGRVDRHYDVLVDAREYQVQRFDVAEGMTRLVESLANGGDGRVAVVARSALTGLQANRVLPASERVVVQDENAAKAWLGIAVGA